MSTFRPTTRHVAVLEELRRRIIQGELKAGDQIYADSLAAELGISRIPVRESLRVLEGEGQVAYEPHQGYSVTQLRMSDLQELYLMRSLLEEEALRRTVALLGPEHFERMRAALAALDVANAARDINGHVTANREFHFAFLEPLESIEMPRMWRQIKVLYDQCDRYGALYYGTKASRQRVRREHKAMFAAARSHDVETLLSLVREHRAHVIEALREPLLARAAAAEAGGISIDARPVRRRRTRAALDASGTP
jgi:DNA-binding GntR family transcriptional regulator